MGSIGWAFVSVLFVIHNAVIYCYITIHTKTYCEIMNIIIATVSENCLVMVMQVFDVLYQHGALDVKSTC